MNAKTFKGLVASLIATILFLAAASAATVKGDIGAVSFDASAKKVTAVQQSTVTIYRTAQGGYTLSPTSEVAFTAYAPGTPGTFSGRVNEDGSITMPAGKRLVMNANFAVVHPIHNALTGFVAPTGTRKLLEVIAPTGDEFGSYRLVGVTTSYAKAEDMVASAPNAFISEYGWAAPAEVKSVWVTNNNPADRVWDTQLGYVGSYISWFDALSGQATHVVTQQTQRRIEFDQSQSAAFTPAGVFATLQVKTLVTSVATEQMLRIAAVPYEPKGKVVHMGGGDNAKTKMWLYDQRTQTSNFTFFGQDLPQEEGNLQILIAGKVLFRVVGVNNFMTSKVYLYNVESGVKMSQFDLPFKVGQASAVAAFRPELSYSPEENALYLAVTELGTLYRVDVDSGAYTQIQIPQGTSGTYGASDVEVDTARRAVYVSALGYAGAWYASASVNGKVFEFPFGAGQPSRSIEIGMSPWQMAVGVSDGAKTIFVTNSYMTPELPGSISRVNVESFTETLPRIRTLGQPTGIALQLK